MTINVGQVELPQLRASPLVLVVAQVRFLPVPALDDGATVEPFRSAVSDEWELIDRQVVQQVGIQFVPGAPPQSNISAAGVAWQFATPDRRWKLALTQSSVAVESTEYSSFADFSERLEGVLGRAAQSLPIAKKSRLGLRYINEVADARLQEPGGLLRFFTPEFLPVGGGVSDRVAASYSEVRFDESDGSLVIRHGLVQPDKYLLDFDYFNETEEQFDVKAIMETTSRYHGVIDSVFARAVTPAYMEEMQQKEPAA